MSRRSPSKSKVDDDNSLPKVEDLERRFLKFLKPKFGFKDFYNFPFPFRASFYFFRLVQTSFSRFHNK